MVDAHDPKPLVSAAEGNDMREEWVALVNMDYSGSYNAKGTEVSRKSCWAEKKDANRNEFWLANEAGHKIDAVFEVSPLDYVAQQVLIHGSDTYNIVRAYRVTGGADAAWQGYSSAAKPDTVQLSCERREAL